MTEEGNQSGSASPAAGGKVDRRFRWAMRLLYLLVMVGLAVMLVNHPALPVKTIRFVDEQGKPVMGAVVNMEGIYSKGRHNSKGWDDNLYGPRGPYTSDADGLIHFSYPIQIGANEEASEVVFSVRHDDFYPDQKTLFVDRTPPGSHTPLSQLRNLITGQIFREARVKTTPDVRLVRGAVVELRGLFEGKPVSADELLPQMNIFKQYRMPGPKWESMNEEVLRSVQVEPRTMNIFLAWLPRKGKACFSELITNAGVAEQTNRIDVILQPGVELKGQLDPIVPRPVVNGRVHVWCPMGKGMSWTDWTEIKPDGTFDFSALPAGRVEMAGICNGYASKRGSRTNVPSAMLVPQGFQISGEKASITLEMEPSASCVVTVTGPDGKPLPGASINYYPNVFTSVGAVIFPGNTYRSAELKQNDSPGTIRNLMRGAWRFAGQTDATGKTLIKDLPAGSHPFGVTHDEFEAQINTYSWGKSRTIYTAVIPGQSNHQQVIMLKKGTEILE